MLHVQSYLSFPFPNISTFGKGGFVYRGAGVYWDQTCPMFSSISAIGSSEIVGCNFSTKSEILFRDGATVETNSLWSHNFLNSIWYSNKELLIYVIKKFQLYKVPGHMLSPWQ